MDGDFSAIVVEAADLRLLFLFDWFCKLFVVFSVINIFHELFLEQELLFHHYFNVNSNVSNVLFLNHF